jgi:Large extracellular alpha-helical protein
MSPIGSVRFYVEDFAPPRIAITSSSKKQNLMAGETGTLAFNARYLFDAPAAELPYEVMFSLFPRNYTHPKWKNFTFGDAQLQIENESTLIASGTLSEQGTGAMIKTKTGGLLQCWSCNYA